MPPCLSKNSQMDWPIYSKGDILALFRRQTDTSLHDHPLLLQHKSSQKQCFTGMNKYLRNKHSCIWTNLYLQKTAQRMWPLGQSVPFIRCSLYKHSFHVTQEAPGISFVRSIRTSSIQRQGNKVRLVLTVTRNRLEEVTVRNCQLPSNRNSHSQVKKTQPSDKGWQTLYRPLDTAPL